MYYNRVFRGEFARGCELCLLGAKSVIFITGLCPLSCFYCPVSKERFGKDVIYVNDIPVDKIEDIPKVVAEYSSEGAAITGGDPSVVAERVKIVADLLKREFGEDFHIHMYTHILNLDGKRVGIIASSRVDEVRIHITSVKQLQGREKYVKALVASGKTIGAEVPALPGFEQQIAEAVNALVPYISFVNINELDISESNLERLKAMGYKIEGHSVYGSLKAAERIAEMVKAPAHICTSRYKDTIQIGTRLFRHMMTIAKPNKYVQDDGTVIYDEDGYHPNSLNAKKIRIKLSVGVKTLEVL
ncbi:Radical SAM domain protein [Pyrobaculum islandicum DSM 4184]|uniref:Radical SAM domain protein n=1 Tax=Pyrobaculum islandicum (strain DSM 4184 / JCM 9189 / GEO3) TaxID=384616 RepID=A1RSL2_PYRIL|nr:radical SAM protein [Pyrobaculum islandicum]ABL87944.1 Radical SAM domain protein [Pyrobaculum islandicum DSM 4184]